MSDIKIFSVNDDVKELVDTQVILEKELQNLIERNMETFLELLS